MMNDKTTHKLGVWHSAVTIVKFYPSDDDILASLYKAWSCSVVLKLRALFTGSCSVKSTSYGTMNIMTIEPVIQCPNILSTNLTIAK